MQDCGSVVSAATADQSKEHVAGAEVVVVERVDVVINDVPLVAVGVAGYVGVSAVVAVVVVVVAAAVNAVGAKSVDVASVADSEDGEPDGQPDCPT